MSKTVIVYWSGTGNTEMMAKEIQEGAVKADADVKLFEVTETSAQDVSQYSNLILGCPAMGAEVLEEGDFEPFFTDLEKNLAGKKVALFGSYGWGDGEWMRNWAERVTNAGAEMVNDEGLIANGEPDDDVLAQCRELGEKVAAL